MKKDSDENINTNFQKIIENILNLNLKIESKLFGTTKFQDITIENKFQELTGKEKKLNKIFSDVVLIFGYFASIFYILFAFYKLEFLIICLVCKLCSIICIVLSYRTNNKNILYLLEHLNIIFIGSSLLSKGLILNFIYYTIENDNESELLRIIIYYFVSTNLFIFLKFEANIYISLTYFSMNFILIIISTNFSNRNHFYFLEAITSTLLTIIFYGFRKVYDYLIRINFSEKFKFERFYDYTFEFITGLNCYHVNIKNKEVNYIEERFLKSLNIMNNFKREIVYNQSSKKNKLDINSSQEKEKFLNNSMSVNISKKENSKIFNNFLNLLSLFDDSYLEEENFNFDKSINYNSFNHLDSEFEMKNLNLKNSTLGNMLEKITEQDNDIKKILINNKNNQRNNSFTQEKDYFKNFIKLGIFTSYIQNNKKYFEIFLRKVYSNTNDFCFDLLFYDVSELILSKITIFEENKTKQKVFAKIAHEFKTPINSIIGLITNLKENFNINQNQNLSIKVKNNSEDNYNLLNIIENLSKYVVFLVSDIIQYSNLKDINQMIINLDKINVRELAIFCFEILKCLLKCSKTKSENIKTELTFDNSLDDLDIICDEIRIKQIILNIISNSVKFTKSGKISLVFKHNQKMDNVFISIRDTGIGIREEDKPKIFNDFVMLKDEDKQNCLGTGLGLSICKSLAIKLNIKLNFDSIYGEGTSFYVMIPTSGREEKEISGLSRRYYNSQKFSKLKRLRNISFTKLKDIKDPTSTNNLMKLFKYDINNSHQENNKNKKNYRNLVLKKIKTSLDSPKSKIVELDSLDHSRLTKQITKKSIKINFNQYYVNGISDNENSLRSNDSHNTSRKNFSKSLENNQKSNQEGVSNKSQIINNSFNLNLPQEQNILNVNFFNTQIIKFPMSGDKSRFHENDKTRYCSTNKFQSETKNRFSKILVADDNQFINDSIKYIIESIMKENNSKLEVIQCQDGIDIVKFIVDDQKEGSLIKCVFTDENMEYLNGSEAIKIIRIFEKQKKIKNVKLFSISSQEDSNTIKTIKESGADQVLGKPVSKSVIFNCLIEMKIL